MGSSLARPKRLQIVCAVLGLFGLITVVTRAWGLSMAWNDVASAVIMIEGSIIGVGLFAASVSHWAQRSWRANRFLQVFVVIAMIDALVWAALMAYAMFFEPMSSPMQTGVWVVGSIRITWSVFKIITLAFCLHALRSGTMRAWLDLPRSVAPAAL